MLLLEHYMKYQENMAEKMRGSKKFFVIATTNYC